MKIAIILLLILSILVVGGCATDIPEITQPEVTQEEAMQEVDESLISEDNEVEIGEII